MTKYSNILKNNRHLFANGTSKINRVLRNFVQRGSIPLIHQCGYTPYCCACKGKVKSRAEMFKLGLSMQNRGYRLDNWFKINLFPLLLGILDKQMYEIMQEAEKRLSTKISNVSIHKRK